MITTVQKRRPSFALTANLVRGAEQWTDAELQLTYADKEKRESLTLTLKSMSNVPVVIQRAK